MLHTSLKERNMKVRQLIDRLQACDPDVEVMLLRCYANGFYVPAHNIVQRTIHKGDGFYSEPYGPVNIGFGQQPGVNVHYPANQEAVIISNGENGR
jgi:hypothetical protein